MVPRDVELDSWTGVETITGDSSLGTGQKGNQESIVRRHKNAYQSQDVVSEWLRRVTRIPLEKPFCYSNYRRYHLGSPAHVRLMPTSTIIFFSSFLFPLLIVVGTMRPSSNCVVLCGVAWGKGS